MHTIDFDIKTRRDGSIEVRHKWVHDVGEPHETTIQSEFRHYDSIDDLAREITYFLNVAEHYGEDTEAALRKHLTTLDARTLKLLSYMVIDLWAETTLEHRQRKVSNRRRFQSLHRAIHEAIRVTFRKSPRLTFGEILAALEHEHSFFRNAVASKLDIIDVWKIGKVRRGKPRSA